MRVQAPHPDISLARQSARRAPGRAAPPPQTVAAVG